MENVLDKTRVPGRMAKMVGRNCAFSSSSRYMVTTVALEKSSLKMSPCTMRTRSATPARCALRWASAARSLLYSMPQARAPNCRAAAIGILPSPAPKSTTSSLGPTRAAVSICVTSSSRVGSHITSLPIWPSLGA